MQVAEETTAEPPFSLTLANLPSGKYVAFVRAMNSLGHPSCSPPVWLTIKPPGDLFANTITLKGYRVSAMGTLAGAGVETGEPTLSA
jgi:hypothetical protein